MPDYDKILTDAEKMYKEVKEFLIENHNDEETTEFADRLTKDYHDIYENYKSISKKFYETLRSQEIKKIITVKQAIGDLDKFYPLNKIVKTQLEFYGDVV